MPDSIYIRVPIALLLPIPAPGTSLNPPSADPPPADPLAGVCSGPREPVVRCARRVGVHSTLHFMERVTDEMRNFYNPICSCAGISLNLFVRVLDQIKVRQEVVPGDPLVPGIYEFHSASPITLSKISERKSHSQTAVDSRFNRTTFKDRIMERDGNICVVSGSPNSVKASHLIPKRMGATGATEVVTRFCGGQVALGIDIFDPRIGIALVSMLDSLMDVYQLGFYHVTGDTYTLHNFDPDYPDLTTLGYRQSLNPGGLPLHLHSMTLLDHGGTGTLPHPGIFDWNYLQCVIRAFGTREYKEFRGVFFFVYPFKTDSNSDGSESSDDQYPDNDEIDPPWPSYHFDKFLREQGRRRMARKRHEVVAQWSSEVASST